MVNYFNMFLVYANKTDDNNHDDVSYTQKERRDKNTCRKKKLRCLITMLFVWKGNGLNLH